MKRFITPPNMAFPQIKAFFTTKYTGGIEAFVKEAIDPGTPVYLPVQKHTDRVFILDADAEPGIADAVITKRKNVLLGVQVADCVPILLFDVRKVAVGAVHAGWRGTAGNILQKTILAMEEQFHSSPHDIVMALGPSIKRCCYQVDADVNEAVSSATGTGDYSLQKGFKYFVDLASANMLQAISSGVPERNIWVSADCTFCNPERFHSYRYQGDHAGRQGGFIGISL